MLEAVARAAKVPPQQVRRARMMAGDLPTVARMALTGGDSALSAFATQLFRPMHPMLAGSADAAEVAMDELGEALLEYKLDGARIQVHKAGEQVAVYSRRLNDVTAAVPELVEAVRALPARELILDGEVIALRPDGTPLPVSDYHEPVRAKARHRAAAPRAAAHPILFRSALRRWRRADRPGGARATRRLYPRSSLPQWWFPVW